MSGDAVEKLWYSASPAAAAARVALRPLSMIFGAGVRLRSELYDRRLATVEHAPAPVISVGALRVGGSGKTPLVVWLARELLRRGRRPCIVTRGYGASAGGGAPWVLDESVASDPRTVERAGDEAVLLALRTGAPVAIGADRAKACTAAFAHLSAAGRRPDLFLLDDGFQHRRLARDLDLVLVSGRESGERLLPAGPLREPVWAIARADVVVAMRDEEVPRGDVARSAPGLFVEAGPRAIGLVASASDPEPEPLAGLEGLRVVAVAGIARPERFLRTLQRAGAHVVATILRRDHHRYGDGDLREIDAAASGADLVVTTEKDLVKVAGSSFRAPLVALRIDVAFASAEDEERLAARAAGLRPI